MARIDWFNESVPLPSGLTISAISRSIDYVESELSDWVEIYFEQMNVFSALVGIMGTKALDSFSQFEKHRQLTRTTEISRFNPPWFKVASRRASECLESKASKRPWAVQSHFDHAGWYIVWRYLVDATATFKLQLSSYGAWTWPLSRDPIGNTKAAAQDRAEAVARTLSGCVDRRRN